MIDISCSIVLYNNPVDEVTIAVNSFLKCGLNVKLYIIDNSISDSFRFRFNHPDIEYVFNGRNLGFGAAHNIAIRRAMGRSKYHLILNPDIEFDPVVLERLFAFMESHSDTGLIMPKVLYDNGEIQYLCKILPSPAHLFMRRFIPGPLKFLFKNMLDKYELKSKDYNCIMESPNLSGCFMFVRTSVFYEVGVFDERYFLYLEDTDLSRRINEKFKTVYYPRVSVIHGYKRASYKSWHLLKYHVASSVQYFNKWGWFNDKKRGLINELVINYPLGLGVESGSGRVRRLKSFPDQNGSLSVKRISPRSKTAEPVESLISA